MPSRSFENHLKRELRNQQDEAAFRLCNLRNDARDRLRRLPLDDDGGKEVAALVSALIQIGVEQEKVWYSMLQLSTMEP